MATSAGAQARDKASAVVGSAKSTASSHPVMLAGVGLIVAQLVIRGWAIYGSWFQFDDFSFMSRMMNEGLTVNALMEPYAGHVMPGGFFLSWLYNEIDPLNFWMHSTTLLLFQAVASFGCLRLLRHAFGERWGTLPLLALYLTSVITLPAFIWWAAGINQLPLQIAFFYGMHAYLTHLRTKRTRYLVAALAWTLFGLVFYEKTLLLFGLYGIVTLAYFATGDTTQRIREVWTEYRPAVIVQSAVAGAYLAFYVLYGLNFDPNGANDHPLAPVAMRLAGQAFATGAVGGPLRWEFPNEIFAIADPSDLTVVAAWVAIAALLIHIPRVRRNAKRAGFLVLFTLGADVLLVAAGRAAFVGPTIALDYRYQTEVIGVVAFALGLAVMPLIGAKESAEVTAPSPFLDNRDRVVAAISVVSVAGLYSSWLYVDHWQGADQSRKYFDNVAAELGARSEPVPLVDTGVPDYLMWAFGYPENQTSHVLKMFSDKTDFPAVTSDQLYIIDSEGLVRPVAISPARRNTPGPVRGCGYRVAEDPVEIPLDAPVFGGPWWLRFGYIADGTSPATFKIGDSTFDTEVEPGVHALYFQVDGEFDSMEISGLIGGTELCTNDVVLGTAEPVATQ